LVGLDQEKSGNTGQDQNGAFKKLGQRFARKILFRRPEI
jgi:hypothetical protein